MSADRSSELRRRQLLSQRGFYRALGGAAGSRCVKLGADVQATVAPARPWFSIFNAVIYDDIEALRSRLSDLRQLYADAEVGNWSVWTRPEDDRAAELLAAEGFTEEGAPLVMGGQIKALELGPLGPLELEANPSLADVAACNDRAHGVLPEFSMAAVFDGVRDSAMHRYAARADGQIASVLLARRERDDCYCWFVATVPEHQGEGLADGLMRLALREALADDCQTATLESTPAAEKLYRSLGFEQLGRSRRWACYES